MKQRGGKREGAGAKKKGAEKTTPFFRNCPNSKYDLLCEYYKRLTTPNGDKK